MSHFYSPDGTFIDGLKLARKTPGALPSVTTCLQMIASPALKIYFQEQVWQATATTPRLVGESDDDWKARCFHAADEHSKAAREKGGEFHDWVQAFHQTRIRGASSPLAPSHLIKQADAYMEWHFGSVKKMLLVEEFVVGNGYAGRLDSFAELNDGRLAVMDVKTQDTTKRKKFNHYLPNVLQLAAYAATLKECDALLNVYVSSVEPVILEPYFWSGEIQDYAKLFLSICEMWRIDHDFTPCSAILPERNEDLSQSLKSKGETLKAASAGCAAAVVES